MLGIGNLIWFFFYKVYVFDVKATGEGHMLYHCNLALICLISSTWLCYKKCVNLSWSSNDTCCKPILFIYMQLIFMIMRFFQRKPCYCIFQKESFFFHRRIVFCKKKRNKNVPFCGLMRGGGARCLYSTIQLQTNITRKHWFRFCWNF